jgi:Leucine-rich repeat (LRR) protein
MLPRGLTVLDLSQIRLDSHAVDSALAGCPGLAELSLESCSLTGALPAELYTLPCLRRLNVAGNTLESLSDAGVATWAAASVLEELDLTNNALAVLNPTLGTITSLRGLLVAGNPIRGVRRQILERGTPALLEYLRDRIPA